MTGTPRFAFADGVLLTQSRFPYFQYRPGSTIRPRPVRFCPPVRDRRRNSLTEMVPDISACADENGILGDVRGVVGDALDVAGLEDQRHGALHRGGSGSDEAEQFLHCHTHTFRTCF